MHALAYIKKFAHHIFILNILILNIHISVSSRYNRTLINAKEPSKLNDQLVGLSDDIPLLTNQNRLNRSHAPLNHHQEQSFVNFNLPNSNYEDKERHLFRIGLIVPKTAFVSLYKTYTQRIKDTFAHLLQLSRHQHQRSVSPPYDHKKPINGQESFVGDNTKHPASASSCLTRESPFFQKHRRLSWSNLTFNQYFDIELVNLVNLAPRSGAQEIINSMCRKLIEQNVSVIIYLENNHDISSLGSRASYPVSQAKAPITNTKQQIFNLNAQDQSISARSRSNLSRNDKVNGAGIAPEDLVPVQINQSEPLLLGGGSNEVQQTSSQAHFIMHLAHSAGIPMIAWSMTAALAQRPKTRRTLHLAPTVAHEARAMLAIMERYSWYSFSVVTTTLAGHEDFILAFKQSIAAAQASASKSGLSAPKSTTSFGPLLSNSSSSSEFNYSHRDNIVSADGSSRLTGHSQTPEVSAQASTSKAFRLVDVIKIKRRSLEHIEHEVRKLTFSESRIILLYSTKGEAMDILKVAKKLKLTKRSYAWIVAQSVIGPDESEEASLEFHPGLLGIYFRSNHERLLDELSRAITIIAHGLEKFVRDESSVIYGQESSDFQSKSREVANNETNESGSDNSDMNTSRISDKNDVLSFAATEPMIRPNASAESYNEKARKLQALHRSMIDYRKKLLSVHSRCQGGLNPLSEKRGDLLYEYFRRSSLSNEFDADGSLKDVELSVMNLDNERQWRKIGCFLDETLTIDDITWPEQAERPPSGTMEKFHLRAVFLEEPSFVNLADPDTETGECKTNRAVRCRYKVVRPAQRDTAAANDPSVDHVTGSNRSHAFNNRTRAGQSDEFEYKCCSGFCIDLMEKFATDLKFSYDLYRVPDGMWGVLENNTWNGLIEEIVKGRADVVISSLKINSDRQKAVEFSVPFLDTGISILVSKQTGVISKLAFLEPFDRLAWIMFICVGIPLAATSIFYFELLSPSGFYSRKNRKLVHAPTNELVEDESSRHQDSTGREHLKFSFCRTIWLVITILFGSAAHIDSPKGYTARFMSNVWATFAVVFLAVYTANLAAFMITREEYLELSGISDPRLACPYHRHPPLKFGTIAGGNTQAVLSANKPNLYEHMRKFNRLSVEDGVEAVKTGQLDAFIYDSLVLDYMAGQDTDCKLLTVGQIYSMTGYALAFAKNSRYYEKFNMKMLEMKKNGELDRLRRFWQQGLCKPGQNRHSISKPLDLSQFMSAFLLLGAGILCSVFILACEHLYAIYLRDLLIKSRHRKRLIELLYPFSLSLADSLRLPSDIKDGVDRIPQATNELSRLQEFSKTTNFQVIECEEHIKKLNEQNNDQFSQGTRSRDQLPGDSMVSDARPKAIRSHLVQTLEVYEAYLENINRSSLVCHMNEDHDNELRRIKKLVSRLRQTLQEIDITSVSNAVSDEQLHTDSILSQGPLDSETLQDFSARIVNKLSRSKSRPYIKEQSKDTKQMIRNNSISHIKNSTDCTSRFWSSPRPEKLAISYNHDKRHARPMWFMRSMKGNRFCDETAKGSSADRRDSCPEELKLGGNTEFLL